MTLTLIPTEQEKFTPDLPAVSPEHALLLMIYALTMAAAYYEIVSDELTNQQFMIMMETANPRNPMALNPASEWFAAIKKEYMNG